MDDDELAFYDMTDDMAATSSEEVDSNHDSGGLSC